MDRVSFWDTYPDAVLVGVFRELKTKRGEAKGSDMMWVIDGMLNVDNKFMQHLPPKERLEELKKFYEVTTGMVNSELFKKSVEWYKKYWISPTRRLLNALREKLFDSQALIENHKIEQTDDIMYFAEMQEAFERFKKSYDEAEASFKAEGPVKRKLGGDPISAADDGSLFDNL